MKTIIAAACAALITVTSTSIVFAETRTAPGEWRPDNADYMERRFNCDPDQWIRVISDITGDTLYTNNRTCKSDRASSGNIKPCINHGFSIQNSAKAATKNQSLTLGSINCRLFTGPT